MTELIQNAKLFECDGCGSVIWTVYDCLENHHLCKECVKIKHRSLYKGDDGLVHVEGDDSLIRWDSPIVDGKTL